MSSSADRHEMNHDVDGVMTNDASHEPSSPQRMPSAGTMVSKLFVVPALIVCLLLGVAVVVVMFGSTSIEHAESVSDLLTRLESDPGHRTLELMLMPGAKEHWQAAQALAQRLAEKEKFLKPEEVEPTAQRIISLLAKFPVGADVEQAGPAQQYFLMMALGRLGTVSGVEALEALLKDPNWSTRRTALQSLAMMSGTPAGRQALPMVYPLLEDSNATVQIVACAAVAALANSGDREATRALSSRLDGNREVQWNAAMALARLGDWRGKLVLMNMLDRGYWESLELEYTEAGQTVRRKYSDVEVANHLKTAIEAAAPSTDEELLSMIRALTEDKAVVVRETARGTLKRQAGSRAETVIESREQVARRALCRAEVG